MPWPPVTSWIGSPSASGAMVRNAKSYAQPSPLIAPFASTDAESANSCGPWADVAVQ